MITLGIKFLLTKMCSFYLGMVPVRGATSVYNFLERKLLDKMIPIYLQLNSATLD